MTVKKQQKKIVLKKRVRKVVHNEKDEISNDLGDAIALQVLHDSEGGQILLEGLVSDILGSIDILCGNIGSLSHTEIIALVCKIKERKDIVQLLTGSKAKKEIYQDLLAEILKKEEENPEPSEEERSEGGL